MAARLLNDERPRPRGDLCHKHQHGGASRLGYTKEYSAWRAMIARCKYPSQRCYANYGGRGVTVCAQWLASYETFLSDVGVAPSAKHTLEREDVNGNYEPSNVRWATQKEQANNTRANVLVTMRGRSQTVSEWADETGIKYQTLWARLFVYKWSPEKALTPRQRAAVEAAN